jgi:spore coat protein U-like protein
MMPARTLSIATLAVLLLIVTRPMAGGEQFPRGLMASVSKEGTCTIETRPVSFGRYDPSAMMDADALGQIMYTCTRDRFGRLLRVRIDVSPGGSGSFEDRRMRSGAQQLSYNLYLDANYRTVWGDGSRGTNYYFDLLPPSDTRTTVPAYGRIFGLQDVEPGEYSDILQVTINF